MEVGRRNEVGEKEEERHAGVGEECRELTSGRSMACSKVSERAQLAGGRVCKSDTGAQLHKITGSLECQPGQGI